MTRNPPAEWKKNWDRLPGLVRDIIFVAAVVGCISLISQISLGIWTPMVAVESGSMVPNLNIGDIVLVQGIARTSVTTSEEGQASGHLAFNMPGDVILYRPYGKEKLGLFDALASLLGRTLPADKATPIIHRALKRVNRGEPMWEGGPAAPFAGYITKGDHNEVIDQRAGEIFGVANPSYLTDHPGSILPVGEGRWLDLDSGLTLFAVDNQTLVGTGISYLTPVREEWVIGVARFKVPYIGYLRLLPGMASNFIKEVLGGG
ncbi:MAG: hypothetical protein A4E45_02182 [Methanosaeta sp. PtaB.Bin039]|nr:MAG: hypothetical protein A4E45_02182 [Methanosaeta sp. PtaB.Bin039]HOT06102.1 S26 family signal peptidase [Methanotrichaceae archaeon]HQF16248.1 S26 family signal peptidase [Methanotrichaceae archaeon]HQI90020.1 S26 family signal peptidase [Methanotrichaceae archaeon]HQJ27956.1 S26 family signal peptidase [Methanotrichaceae archaeon]